ncbi:MAG: right-handed parallel beta-helix repeat-containing protein, partial [Verrucomicrobiota bacterium]|nr:right-handed parallel beta-helix repeat-containing protein [Verrucomicrobiota bacterium]
MIFQRTNKNRGLLAVLVCLGALSIQAADYYVATNGNDAANDGLSIGTPFQTIQQAASAMDAGDTCFIRGGTYRETVTPSNSGLLSAPITFTNHNGESVLVSGLDEITNLWSPDTGGIHQVAVPLALGSKNQVFVEGAMAYEARWPNNTGSITYYSTARPTSNGTQSPDGKTNYLANAAFPFSSNTDLDGASLLISPGLQWQTYVKPIRSYSSGTQTIAYDAPRPGSSSWIAQTDDFFYIFGSKALLDADNEWWYDSTNGVLYLQAPGGVDPCTLTVEVKARELGFDLQNRNYITIGGLNIKGCRIKANMANGIKLRSLNCQYVAHDAANRAEGIYLRGSDNEVVDCEIAFSSDNLLNLELSNNGRLVNNHVHDGNYILTSRMFKAMGSGHIVSHNTISDSPGNLVRLEMQGGVFQYNHVFNGCWALRDCGLVYNNYTDGQNAVVQRNVFHDNMSESTNMSHAIYHDAGTSDYIIYRNIFYGNLMTGMKINSPFHHLVYNNTSYNTSRYAVRYEGLNLPDMASDRPDGTELANNLITCNNITLDPGDPVERNPYSTRNLDPLVSNPAYVNEAMNDFRLAAASPARDKGIGIPGVTGGFEGAAPDIGALEYGEAMFKTGHDFSSRPVANLLVLPDLSVFQNRNRVVNGSLEYGESSWIKGDAATMVCTNQISSATDSVTLNGFYSARLGPAVDSISQTVSNLVPGMRYVASAWAKAEAGQTAEFTVTGHGGAALTESTTATTWTPLDIWFTNGVADTAATLMLRKSNSSGSSYIYMDLCALKQSPAPSLPIQQDLGFNDNPAITISNAAQYAVASATVDYQLVEAPSGAGIDSDGVITWQPLSTDVPGSYRFTTVVQDADIPSLAASNTFLVSLVAEPRALLYEGFVAGINNSAGQYVANPGSDTSGRHKFITGQNPGIVGFFGEWLGLGGAQYELGTAPLSSLDYPGVLTTGNAAFRRWNNGGSTRALEVTNSFAAYRNGDGKIGKDDTTLYVSFLMKLDDATSVGSLGFGASSGADSEVRVQANGSNFVFRANYLDSPATVPVDTGTHLFVLKFEFGDTD